VDVRKNVMASASATILNLAAQLSAAALAETSWDGTETSWDGNEISWDGTET